MRTGLFSVLLIAAVCCGCATSSDVPSRAGVATRETVLQFNGKPSRTTRDAGGNEVWIYPQRSGDSLLVTFNRDGTVMSQSMRSAGR